ncbi:glycosyltransferase, partial [Roseomonas mucosa]|uniref:glycosyltransferase n=2 Tax=Roseomonadaceae TaxID=3385906 RepID=UPI0028CDD2D8
MTPKVAIVHEWLDTYAGSERVLEQMLRCWPEADIFAVCDFLPPGERGFLQGRSVRTSFIQRLPFARKHFRKYLGLMPLAVSQLDLTGYDIVVSSHHAVAKGVIVGPSQVHVSYVHSPMRYAWDLQHQYLRQAGLERGPMGAYTRWLLHRLRQWDRSTAAGVDVFVANSAYIGERVRKTWRREAEVIYPPVDLESFSQQSPKEDFFLVASRFVPYKR